VIAMILAFTLDSKSGVMTIFISRLVCPAVYLMLLILVFFFSLF
jgi:hypothetical protein